MTLTRDQLETILRYCDEGHLPVLYMPWGIVKVGDMCRQLLDAMDENTTTASKESEAA